MVSFSLFGQVVVTLAATALASPDSTRCYTRLGSTAAAFLHTSWTTHYTPCTVTTTVYPSATTVGSSVTVTRTSTTTRAAPSSFIPVVSSAPGLTCDSGCGGSPASSSKRRRQAIAVDELEARRSLAGALPLNITNLLGTQGLFQFPQTVNCQKWTPDKCTTLTKTGAPRSTVNPTATVVTTTTVFAACATNNIADLYNGHGISNVKFLGGSANSNGPTGSMGILEGGSDSAYDCCVGAIALPSDEGYSQVWGYDFVAGTPYCVILTTNTCPSGEESNQWTPCYGDETFVVGNGVCGEIVGQDDPGSCS